MEFSSNDFFHFHNALKTATRAGCSLENEKNASSSKSTPRSRAVPDNEQDGNDTKSAHAATAPPRRRSRMCVQHAAAVRVCVTRGKIRKLF